MRSNPIGANRRAGSAYLENRLTLKDLATVMLKSLKRQWRELRKGRPGQRFRAQFEQNKRATAGKSRLRRCLPIFAGAGLLIVGIFLCLIPGPGVPFIVLGAGLLAKRFRAVASALDWLEVRLRQMKRRATAWWRQASIPARGAAALLTTAAIAGVGYGAFQVAFGD